MDKSVSEGMLQPFILWALVSAVLAADFQYRDFNDTTGLSFNGNASTSNCGDGTPYVYSSIHNINEANSILHEAEQYSIETSTRYSVTNRSTVVFEEGETISSYFALGGHRDVSVIASRSNCPVRIRLTGSRPRQVSTVFRGERHPVLSGFETGFRFQISDQMRQCTQVKDRRLSTRVYQSCRVAGGDGFAFVVHGDAAADRVVGEGAAGLGYQGISNGLAVEFDYWTNTEPGFEDIFADHIAVHASTPRFPILRAKLAGAVTPLKPITLADGLVHTVRIVYYSTLIDEAFEYLTATDLLQELLTDDGDQRRLGTLIIYVDDMTAPAMSLPISLDTALQLSEDQANIGFTGSTGYTWAKQDILEWYYCEKPGCPLLTGDPMLIHYRPRPVP